jgi:hypothetical protein
MARTKYQSLRSAKASYCAGRGKKTTLTKAKTAYIKDAIKKGKSRTEATKIANKVVNGSCKTRIGATRKRKTAKKKTTARRRR